MLHCEVRATLCSKRAEAALHDESGDRNRLRGKSQSYILVHFAAWVKPRSDAGLSMLPRFSGHSIREVFRKLGS